MFTNDLQIHIKARFKFYPYIVCNDKKELYQLPHFKNKRVYPFKKLSYNKKRNSYGIYSQNVSKNRLTKNIIKIDEIIEIYS